MEFSSDQQSCFGGYSEFNESDSSKNNLASKVLEKIIEEDNQTSQKSST
jgi:hypothetical protein